MVIDTGLFIEHIRAKDKLNTTLYLIPDNTELFVSSISMYELYMGATTKEKENEVRSITEDLQILPFTDAVAFKAAQLYHQLKKQNKLIEFRDIFIGATCLAYNFPLKTTNTKHFARISGIVLV